MDSILRIALLALLCCAPLSAQTPSAAPTPAPAVTPKAQFLIRLIPPRSTFVQDMTPHEADVMQQHAAYWAGLFKTGKVLIVGPVLDPKSPWGMAVVECATQAEADQMLANDPSVKAGVNHYEIAPMHVFLRKKD